MSRDRIIVIVGAALPVVDHLIDHAGLTAPLDLGPRRIEIAARPEPIIPAFDAPILPRRTRDWEQRSRKKRHP